MRISKEKKITFKVETAYNEILNRLNNYGIKHIQNISLDSSGFGHAWIKYTRYDRKAGYIFICSHSDNMDPLCCDPIYRFIKVYNYCDDVLDDNLLGETAIFSHNSSSLDNINEWKDNVSYLITKDDVAWVFMKDPETGEPVMPYTNYPMELSGVTDNWKDSQITLKDDNQIIYTSGNPTSSFKLDLDEVIEKEDILYCARQYKNNQYYLLGFTKNNVDINGNYIPVYPLSINKNYPDQYLIESQTNQELNYFTHCKTNTFDYPWNYDEIMNFVLYKDENLHITPNFDKLLMADSNSIIDWNIDTTKNCNLYDPLDNSKLAYSPCEPDNCASVNGRNEIFNYDDNGDVAYSDIESQISGDGNFYNYNQLMFNKGDWSTENTKVYYTETGSRQRAFPVYEGIYAKVAPESYDYYNSYAWLRTSASSQEDLLKDYYTGNLDTIEFKQNYKNHHFLFLDQNPIKSIYYKETFNTPSAVDVEAIAGGYGYLLTNFDNKFYKNEKVILTNNYYPIIDKHNINLFGVDNYRHICPTCLGIGVKGITLHANHIESGSQDNYALAYHKYHSWRCPTCAGRGVRIRYVYFDYDLLTSGCNCLSINESDKAKELLYETTDDPYKYWYFDGSVFNAVNWDYKSLFNYIDVSGVNIDSDGKPIEPTSDYSTSAYTGKMFRWENNMDEIISFSAYEPVLKQWCRIYFDNDYIKNQWNKNHNFKNIMPFEKEKIYIDKKDHDHDIDDNDLDYKRTDYVDSFNSLMNYHTVSALNDPCPICNGTGEITVEDTDQNGNTQYDFYGNIIYKTIICPTCFGNKIIEKKYDEHYGFVTCSNCNGTGKETCLNCHGSGKVNEETCTMCEGTGEIDCRYCHGKKLDDNVTSKTKTINPDRLTDKYVWKVRNKYGINSDNISVELYPYE